MSESILTLRSSIQPALIRRTVIRGTLLSGIGGLLLLLSGIFLPTPLLKIWGLPIFALSLALITWGLWPYRRLKNLENNPYRLSVDQKEWLHFSEKGKPVFSLPLKNISKTNYIENQPNYGIGLYLKEGSRKSKKPKPVRHQANIDQFLNQQTKPTENNYDIFLPYFSKNSQNELETLLHSDFDADTDHNPD